MKKNIKLVLQTLFITFAISFDPLALYSNEYLNLFKIDYTFMLIIMLLLFYALKKDNKKSNYIINILSTLFSLLTLFGYSYLKLGTADLVFANIGLFIISIIMAISYFIIFKFSLKQIFYYIDSRKFLKETRNLSRFRLFLDKYPFRTSLIIILLCWLPYIIAFYPGILSPDPSFQIRQFFGIWTKYNDYSVMLDNSVLITNHHPVIHTLLLGSCLKIGTLLGNDNFGIFICSFIQLVFLATTLSYTIKYMNKLCLPYKYKLLALIIYAIVPMFPLYSISLVKDVIFTCFIIYFIIYIHKILRNDLHGFKDILLFILIMLGTILFRNNGIYVVIISLIGILIMIKEFRKKCLILLIVIFSFSKCYNAVILPYFKITPGSIREMLSIPFQQTARYVKYYKEELSDNDIEVIDKVLDIHNLSNRYNPEISDPVKNRFNKYATNEDLKEYFKVWFKHLKRHPGIYIDATINNTYGYFYPNKINWYVYFQFDDRIVSNGFDYHYNSLSIMRQILSGFAIIYPGLPGIGLLSNIGFNVWILLLMLGYLIYHKKYREIVFLIPSLVSLLVCIASPVNCYFRYAMPFIFSMPLTLAFLLDTTKKGEV